MSSAHPINAPRENANDEYVIVVNWLTDDRSRTEKDQAIATVESMKTTYEIVAPEAGYLIHACAEGDQVGIGEPLAFVADNPDYEVPQESKPASGGSAKTVFTKKAERLIDELGLDRGSFTHLEIVKEKDVRAVAADETAGNSAPDGAESHSREIVESIPAAKQFEIDSLTRSARTTIYSSVVRAISFDRLKSRVEELASEIGAVSPGECIMLACAKTLVDFPEFNSRFADGRLRKYTSVNLSFAININRKGLRTPVIRDTNQHDQAGLSKAVKGLALKYLRDELSGEDLRDGTFTVSDLSTMGVTMFTPVINDRQSAILGICSPPPGSDWFNLILAFDHRVADGMLAAQFLESLEASLF
jgi:pyruvate/2-oxoglutarate dehydrogenase complex dihydrolipoamide acyltransferase (E2) component